MGHEGKARNAMRVAKGTVKEAAGKTFGDENLEAEGRSDQVVGHLNQAGEKVRSAFKE
ncbi:MAG TPA: CsbD family protein [Acidimicrobiales bacterium]|jgi:uncharacterized protein YjbJ (UPF0337 family)|nr:CsbD family protein [Acidimicrobiales bacterium]